MLLPLLRGRAIACLVPEATEPRIAVLACPTADGQKALRWGTPWGGRHDEGVVLCGGMPRPGEGWRAIEWAQGRKVMANNENRRRRIGTNDNIHTGVANLDAKAWKPLNDMKQALTDQGERFIGLSPT